jgi:hypothetical protein
MAEWQDYSMVLAKENEILKRQNFQNGKYSKYFTVHSFMAHTQALFLTSLDICVTTYVNKTEILKYTCLAKNTFI